MNTQRIHPTRTTIKQWAIAIGASLLFGCSTSTSMSSMSGSPSTRFEEMAQPLDSIQVPITDTPRQTFSQAEQNAEPLDSFPTSRFAPPRHDATTMAPSQYAEPLDSVHASTHHMISPNMHQANTTSPAPMQMSMPMPMPTPEPIILATNTPIATNRIVIDNFTFKPATLTIPAGSSVTWVNQDDVPHTATANLKPRAFDSGTLDTDQQYTFAFKTPGTYDYFCAVHPHMTGKIIVK